MKRIQTPAYFKIGIFAALLLFFGVPSAAIAQKDSTKKAKLEQLKQKRIELWKSKLALTETEAAGFFPIMNEYQLKMRTAKQEFRKKWKGKTPETLSETEAAIYLEDAIKLREKELELFKTYSAKLKTVIPASKIVKIPKVEKEIEKELKQILREIRKKK